MQSCTVYCCGVVLCAIVGLVRNATVRMTPSLEWALVASICPHSLLFAEYDEEWLCPFSTNILVLFLVGKDGLGSAVRSSPESIFFTGASVHPKYPLVANPLILQCYLFDMYIGSIWCCYFSYHAGLHPWANQQTHSGFVPVSKWTRTRDQNTEQETGMTGAYLYCWCHST